MDRLVVSYISMRLWRTPYRANKNELLCNSDVPKVSIAKLNSTFVISSYVQVGIGRKFVSS